jgi:UDP-N-acetyl-D-glucosamine dehydrogenase
LRDGDKEAIGVFGLGFVGSSIAAVWLREGATVVGYDISAQRLSDIKNSSGTEADREVAATLRDGVRSGKLALLEDGVEASKRAVIKFVCVPVYLKKGNGDRTADLTFLKTACSTLAKGLKKGDAVVICPSVPPGTTRRVIARILEEESPGNLRAGLDYDLIYSPERIFVGRAIKDIEENYPAVVSGINEKSLARAEALYSRVARKGVVKMPTTEAAEFEKLAEGVYRDVNIALANELALVCDELGVDYFTVREAANSQPYCSLHLPGLGVGGACIPVYPLFVAQSARRTKTTLISESRRINDSMSLWMVDALREAFGATPTTKIALLGLAFRGGIADSRLSITYKLVEALKSNGLVNFKVHDPLIQKDPTIGGALSSDLDAVLEWCDVALIVTDHKEYRDYDWNKIDPARPLRVIDGRGVLRGKRLENVDVVGLGYGKERVHIAER